MGNSETFHDSHVAHKVEALSQLKAFLLHLTLLIASAGYFCGTHR